ncbi:MAG: hypothetical protein HYT03_02445 [Candidatus Harrisonbacteria bacterium]|nr:hypothetical protein [Candidatus Harrisonbacteria bacterium]
MKKYRILKSVILSFLTPQDQSDEIIEPKDGVILESDGRTIWAIKNRKRHESITVAHAIEYWLDIGAIIEISSEEGQ